MIDLDSQRASHALANIRQLREQAEKETGTATEQAKATYGNYVSFVKALPAAILINGLGQALASELAAKGNKNATQIGHDKLFQHINTWLGRNDPLAPYPNAIADDVGILNALVDGDQHSYTIAQQEAMAYLGWLKKFAVALLIVTFR